MATTGKKKTTSKTAKPRVRRAVKDTSLAEIESSMKKIAFMDFAESTKKELKKLSEVIHEAADKGAHVAREVAEDMRKFAKDARNLTMIKMKLHSQKTERDRLYCVMGKRLNTLNKTKNLSNIKSKFKDDFAKLNELDSAIKKNKKQAGRISLTKHKK